MARFGLQRRLLALIESLGCPFATMAMDKAVLSEAHPQFVGMYAGAPSSPDVREAVEGADLVLDAGGVFFSETNTSTYSARPAPEKVVTIAFDHVRIGDRIYNPVRMGDVFDRLAASAPKRFDFDPAARPRPEPPGGAAGDPITAATLYPRYREFLRPGDRLVLESGTRT